MSDESANPRLIKAEPTKEFFISMLVRDIELIPAIIDLVDNSVDGARRLRPDGEFAGLWVRIEADKEHFRIADNCGGIPAPLAREYAFRFGRPKNTPTTPHSVGQFGVGMKRALFKLGTAFSIESVSAESRFTLTVDVDDWSSRPEWDFEFTELEEETTNTPDSLSTTITVDKLHPSVAADLALREWQSRFRADLESKHQESMARGIAISLNGVPLSTNIVELLASDELHPAKQELVFEDGPTVRVQLYAGIHKSVPNDAGWYIFCNGRMLLRADQTVTTGWGLETPVRIPRFHNQFARFRGYAFFDSDDASRLPWNTTKTGVDTDSEIYRSVFQAMIALMRPVITFLNRLDVEVNADKEATGPLESAVEAATSVPTREAEGKPIFEAPKPVRPPTPPDTTSIQYRKSVFDVRRVKRSLKVTSNREVGERTFDYYVRAECDDDEA